MGHGGGSGRVASGGGRDEAPTAVRPSTVKLPERPPNNERTVFEFFLRRFPRISRTVWLERFTTGKVWATETAIDAETPLPAAPRGPLPARGRARAAGPGGLPDRVVESRSHGHRQTAHLPVTPGGRWVRGCLLHLLLEATGNDRIAPLHRLDRLTSGLVLLSLDPATRPHFARLFQPHPMVEKDYTAICELRCERPPRRFTLAHHIARSETEYWRQVVRPGLPPNAKCDVEIMAVESGLVHARVRPLTGRKHQIRVELAARGSADPRRSALRHEPVAPARRSLPAPVADAYPARSEQFSGSLRR